MFDWITSSGVINFALDSAGSAAILSIVAFLSIFAAGLAERAYRMQSLGVLAGVATAMLLATIFILATIGHAVLGLAWVQRLVSGELFFYIFCLSLGGLWLAAVLSSSRLSAPPRSRRVFVQWQIFFWSLLTAILACGAGESNGIFHFPLNAALRQIFVGIAAGIFIIAAGIAIYRLWRERAALWLGLALASLAFAGAVSLFHFLPQAPLLACADLGLAAFLVIGGLFADHVRFLRLESELRAGFMESALKLEEENRRQTAILELTREAVVQLDREEHILYANPNFLQFASGVTSPVQAVTAEKSQSGKPVAPAASPAQKNETNLSVSQLAGKKLSTLLPREFYQQLIPAMQEAQLGRSALMEIRRFDAGDEKLLQVFAAPLRDKYDKFCGLHLGLQDLTARHLTARALENAAAEKARELRIFQQCVENALEGVAITDTGNKILYANAAFERITGFARSEIIGRTPQACHLEGEPGRFAEISRRLLQQKSWRGEVPGRRKDGGSFISDLSVSPVTDVEEHIIRYIWVERDVTALKELQERLRRQAGELEEKNAALLRAGELQQRNAQLEKLMEIGEDIRLNVDLDLIMQKVGEAAAALGWQHVLIFQRRGHDLFALVASSGLAKRSAAALRQLQQVPYAEFALCLLERCRLSQSFLIDSRQLAGMKRLAFMPASFPEPPAIANSRDGDDWLSNDALLVPIRSRDQFAGFIVAATPADGRRPDLQRVRDLELLADDAAIAIENSRLLALHQRNEQQARVLAEIGEAFRLGETLEQVMADIAGISGRALACPCLVVLQPSNSHGWLSAIGGASAKSGRPPGRLLDAAELPPLWLASLADAVAKTASAAVELNESEAPALVNEAVKAKASGAAHHAQQPGTANVVALRLRGRNLGFMAHLAPANVLGFDFAFASAIADRAALIIENTRLFHETGEKALAQERANQLIAEFLASVSHELRTPMHSILQFSEILLSEAPGALNPEQKRQLEVVQRSGKNLLALLNDILDLSKIEAGKMEAAIEEFEPAQLIREAAESIRPLCEKKSVALQAHIDENLPEQFRSDRSILSRVLTNLLGNAVKFTEKGEIEIRARLRAHRTLVITVRDTGIGIPASRQKEIFEPFRQLETSETRRHGGTGLGLAISQKMLALLHGKIEVESAPGKGAKFTVHIPESALPARGLGESGRARGDQKIKKTARQELPAKKDKSLLRFLLAKRAKSPRILVVEDDESTRYAMQFILENAGYQVEFAEAGEKALLAAQHQRPDLILMDIMMPNMDGYQVARMLKAQKQLAHIPVIALTARAMKGDREKALDAGCNDYLTKPFESKDILGMLEKWLDNRT
jgi:PAS domain S-box-containing protein